METIEVSSYDMEDAKWDFWKIQLVHEECWVKSVSNTPMNFLEEIGF